MNQSNPNYFLFIDPGKVKNGWATWSNPPEINFTGCGTLRSIDELDEWLYKLDPKPEQIGVEEYRVYPWVSHKFSKVPTIKSIGSIHHYARKNGHIDVVEIPAWVKNDGYKWAGIEKPKDKNLSHQNDAIAIGVFWLQRNKIKDFLND